MKRVLWFFSVLYVAIPGVVVWMAWTNQMTFREGLELETKLLISAVLFAASFAANYFAWSNFLGWRRKNETKREKNQRDF